MEDIELKRELIIIDGMVNALVKQAEDIDEELNKLDITNEQGKRHVKELLEIGVKLGKVIKILNDM